MPDREIVISITEGRTIRDLLYNGLLEFLRAAGFSKITIFTEAVQVSEFIREFEGEGISFRMMHDVLGNKGRNRAFYIRRKLARINKYALNKWIQFEEHIFFPPPEEYIEYFNNSKPVLLLTTHAHLIKEAELISAAHRCGVPTLGIVRSWDNVHKGIRSRPEKLTAWNEINKRELVKLEGYRPEDILITGAPQFDQYFLKENIKPRKQFFREKGLDEKRPLIFYASLGYFFSGNDETEWMDRLLELMDAGELTGYPQVICRLHPWSRYEHFEKYGSHPDVRLSYCNRYWPALTWYMTTEDMIDMANMLAHCDLVITPGSTVTLEAAIFNKPTLVPIFHTYQFERMKNYFNTWVLGKHFGRIEKLNLVPFAKTLEEFKPKINKCLSEPHWYREGRSQIVKDYIHFTDGKATERIAAIAGTYLKNNQVLINSHETVSATA